MRLRFVHAAGVLGVLLSLAAGRADARPIDCMGDTACGLRLDCDHPGIGGWKPLGCLQDDDGLRSFWVAPTGMGLWSSQGAYADGCQHQVDLHCCTEVVCPPPPCPMECPPPPPVPEPTSLFALGVTSLALVSNVRRKLGL